MILRWPVVSDRQGRHQNQNVLAPVVLLSAIKATALLDHKEEARRLLSCKQEKHLLLAR